MADLVREINPKFVCERALHLSVTKQGNAFLWSNGMENADGVLSSWHASAREMIELAKTEPPNENRARVRVPVDRERGFRSIVNISSGGS